MLPPHSFLRADVDLQTGLGPSACRRILGADRGVTGGIKRVEVGEVGKKGVDGKRLRRVGASPNSLGTVFCLAKFGVSDDNDGRRGRSCIAEAPTDLYRLAWRRSRTAGRTRVWWPAFLGKCGIHIDHVEWCMGRGAFMSELSALARIVVPRRLKRIQMRPWPGSLIAGTGPCSSLAIEGITVSKSALHRTLVGRGRHLEEKLGHAGHG